MKRVYLILLLLGIVSNLFSQQWVKNLPQGKSKDQLTLSNYKDAFNQFWAPFNVDKGYYNVNGVQTKAPGWKQFKRWEYYMESQINPTTGEFPKQTALQIYRDYFKATPFVKSSKSCNFGQSFKLDFVRPDQFNRRLCRSRQDQLHCISSDR